MGYPSLAAYLTLKSIKTRKLVFCRNKQEKKKLPSRMGLSVIIPPTAFLYIHIL